MLETNIHIYSFGVDGCAKFLSVSNFMLPLQVTISHRNICFNINLEHFDGMNELYCKFVFSA